MTPSGSDGGGLDDLDEVDEPAVLADVDDDLGRAHGRDDVDVGEETHRGAFGEFGGTSGAFIERTFREKILLVEEIPEVCNCVVEVLRKTLHIKCIQEVLK